MKLYKKIIRRAKKPRNFVWYIILFCYIFAIPAGLTGELLSFNLLVFIASMLLLVKSADFLVSGSSRLATFYGIPQLVIGMTIVAFGTSLPELTVSVMANWVGSSGMSVGNVVGSNISNICLVLGIAAIIIPLKEGKDIFKFDMPFLVMITMLLPLLSLGMFTDFDGNAFVLGRIDGLILLALFVFFLYMQYQYSVIKHGSHNHKRMTKVQLERRHKRFIAFSLTLIAGIVGLIVSAGLLVDSGRGLALIFGVPEYIIGLTMIAVGTSLPELATNVVAAIRRKLDLAIGNVIGSNIFNILMVLGATSVIKPLVIADTSIVTLDMAIMVGVTALLAVLLKLGHKISRYEGILLVSIYIIYIAFMFMRLGSGI